MSFESVARSGIKIKPLIAYPGKITRPVNCPYKATFSSTIKTLLKELKQLQAKNITLEVGITSDDFRNDGLPRAQAKMSTNAVVLSFDSKRGPLRLYGCKFHYWADNLRAIVLHLEHLRLSMIHGIGEDGEQYKGWAAITMNKSRFNSKDEAARFIANAAGFDSVHNTPWTKEQIFQFCAGNDMYNLNEAYRAAAARLHPDTDGGDTESFKMLVAAKEMLEAK